MASALDLIEGRGHRRYSTAAARFAGQPHQMPVDTVTLMTRSLPAAALATLALAGCSTSSPAPTATVTQTVTTTATATVTPTATPTTEPSSSTPATPTETTSTTPETTGSATDTAPTTATAGPDGAQTVPAGSTVTMGAGIQVTATWGEWTTRYVSPADPDGKAGCQVVHMRVRNSSPTDVLTSRDAMDGTEARPSVGITMTAGDTLHTVDYATGDERLSWWPTRVKAGKTETFTQCWKSREQEQHLALSLITGPGRETPVAEWVRK